MWLNQKVIHHLKITFLQLIQKATISNYIWLIKSKCDDYLTYLDDMKIYCTYNVVKNMLMHKWFSIIKFEDCGWQNWLTIFFEHTWCTTISSLTHRQKFICAVIPDEDHPSDASLWFIKIIDSCFADQPITDDYNHTIPAEHEYLIDQFMLPEDGGLPNKKGYLYKLDKKKENIFL